MLHIKPTIVPRVYKGTAQCKVHPHVAYMLVGSTSRIYINVHAGLQYTCVCCSHGHFGSLVPIVVTSLAAGHCSYIKTLWYMHLFVCMY